MSRDAEHPHPQAHPPHPADHVPPPKPHWSIIDQLPDEELLRFAPPEIRRLHRKVSEIESGQQRLETELGAIRALLEQLLARPGRPGGGSGTT